MFSLFLFFPFFGFLVEEDGGGKKKVWLESWRREGFEEFFFLGGLDSEMTFSG